MYSKKIKFLSGWIMSVFLFSGCGISDSLDSATSSVSSLVSASAETSELQILENLPEGTLAGASRSTSGLFSKAEAILSLKQYFPEEMLEKLEAEIPSTVQAEFLNAYIGGFNISYIIRPKVDEILFASLPTNPDPLAQEYICAAGEFIIEKKRVNSLIPEILKNPKFSGDMDEEAQHEIEKFMENPDSSIAKFSEKLKSDEEYEVFKKYADFTLTTDKDFIILSLSTNACDDADKKILAEFSKAVLDQDVMNKFISVDRKFFAPFLVKGNFAVVKIAMAEGEKQLWAEAEKNGFDVEKLKKLKSEILDPWGRTHAAKMIQSFEKISYVSGAIEGNLLDRQSEFLIKFSDEESAERIEEIQRGKIPSKKMWLHDGAKMTAKVSRNGGTVYDYTKYENTEYPSALAEIGGNTLTILSAITVVGIIATVETAFYSGAQEKAREAQRIN